MRFQRRSRENGPFSAIWTATIVSKVAFCRELKTEKLSLKSQEKLPLKNFRTRCAPLPALGALGFVLSARARARADGSPPAQGLGGLPYRL